MNLFRAISTYFYGEPDFFFCPAKDTKKPDGFYVSFILCAASITRLQSEKFPRCDDAVLINGWRKSRSPWATERAMDIEDAVFGYSLDRSTRNPTKRSI